MKKTVLPLLIGFISLNSFAQVQQPLQRTITVTGSAEMEIVPDEIYVQVELKEYEKKGGGKVGIDQIREDFLKREKQLGLPDSSLSVAAYDGSNGNPWQRKKNRKDEMYASISYQIKLNSIRQIDQLVDMLDDKATQNFFIVKTSHSRIAGLRKSLKIEAVKAAREKAGYLAEAIGEKAGQAVTISEPVEYFAPYVNMVANRMYKSTEAAEEGNGVDYKKVKLKYEVTVVFALM
jgi:uncharacterized protein YggE